MTGKIKNWLEIRIGLDELVRAQLTEYRVPREINIFYTLGFVALGAFHLPGRYRLLSTDLLYPAIRIMPLEAFRILCPSGRLAGCSD